MAEILLPFAHVWGLTLLLAALFAGAGAWFHRLAFVRQDSASPFYFWGLAYFLGLFLYLFLLRLVEVVSRSAKLACYSALLTLVVLAVLALLQGEARRQAAYLRRVFPAAVLLTALYTGTTLALWTAPTLDIDYWTGFGSGHSGRYANIGIFMADQDVIPRVGQNYGQSLLVGTHLLLGTASPLASLTAWLAVSLAMLTLFLYGFFRQVVPTALWGGVATYTFLGCNIALSLTYVCTLANGSPFLFIPYTDMAASVATCVAFVVWLDGWLGGVAPRPRLLLLPALAGVVWNWCSPENVVTCSVLIAALAVLGLLRLVPLLGLVLAVVVLAGVGVGAFLVVVSGGAITPGVVLLACAALTCAGLGVALAVVAVLERGRVRRLVLAGAVLGAAVVLGATQGGMLMPKWFALHTEIPGVASFASDVVSSLEWEPGVEFIVSRRFTTEFIDGEFAFGRYFYPQDEQRISTFGVETALWMALRVLFFPVLGIAGLALLAVLGKASVGGMRPETLRLWALCAGVVFLTGFLIEFSFAFVHPMSGFKWDGKWDLARLPISGVVLGLVCLIFVAQAAAQGLARRPPRAALWLGLAALCTFGPAVAFARTCWSNVVVGKPGAPWAGRLQVLFHTREVLPETYFDRYVNALKAGNVQARRHAAAMLAPFGASAEKAVANLTACLDDSDAEVRRLAAIALVKIQGPAAAKAVPILISALESGPARARREAAQALAEMGPEARDAVPALTRLAQTERGVVQGAAAFALVQVQGAEAADTALPGLLVALKEGDAPLRQGVALCLMTLGPEAAAPAAEALAALLTDADVATRRTAASSLVHTQGAAFAKAVLPVLVEALRDPEPSVRRNYAWTLGLLGPAAAPAADAVAGLLQDADETTRWMAASTLVRIKGAAAAETAAVPVLIEGLKDPRLEWRQLCAESLGLLGPGAGRAAEALAGALREVEGFRDAAAEALKKIQEK